MPLFIVFSLALCLMVQNASSLQSLLMAPPLIDVGLGVAIISILGGVFKKRWILIWYDIFSSSTLLIWFAYWKPFFKEDAPIFFFYPLFFALVTAFVSLFFIGQRHKIDEESFRFMRSYSKKNLLQSWILMVGVLGSLGLRQNFMLYPVMMTLLIMRFALTSCMEGQED
ncbi:MAG: hypothetical protein WCP01_01450 [Methylococcaceae bacterium]|jgi:hypothetical protein